MQRSPVSCVEPHPWGLKDCRRDPRTTVGFGVADYVDRFSLFDGTEVTNDGSCQAGSFDVDDPNIVGRIRPDDGGIE